MITDTNVAALILAAGYSSRMKDFKPLSMLGEITAAERCVNVFKSVGIEDIRVVVGYRHFDLEDLLKATEIRLILNSRFPEGMFSSIKAGLSSFDAAPQGFFLLPVDIPLVRTNSVIRLLETFNTHNVDVIYPCFMGKRGHPPLIRGSLIPDILNFSGEGGLRSCLRNKSAFNLELPDENVLRDMDTPEHYSKILERLKYYETPSAEECMAFLKHDIKLDDESIKAASVTSTIADKLCAVLNERRLELEPRLVTTGALLYSAFSNMTFGNSLITRLTDIFGYSSLIRLLQETNSVHDPNEGLMKESKVVALANLLSKGDNFGLIEDFCRRYMFDIELVKSIGRPEA